MRKYKNLSGDSGVVAYSYTEEKIAITFQDGETYVYSNSKPGRKHVSEMKKLARKGQGLATYINKYVRGNYESKA